jgi:hypothetical protein
VSMSSYYPTLFDSVEIGMLTSINAQINSFILSGKKMLFDERLLPIKK